MNTGRNIQHIQIKMMLRFHLTPVRMAIISRKEASNGVEYVEVEWGKNQPINNVGGRQGGPNNVHTCE
jgi:hypothetical protein